MTQNHRISSTYRVSPYLSREVSPRVSLLARYDETWTRADADTLANQRFSKLQFAATAKPVPVGGTLELSRQDVRLFVLVLFILFALGAVVTHVLPVILHIFPVLGDFLL